MKQYTTSHSVRELQAKMRRNRSRGPIEMLKAQNTNTTKSHKNLKKLGLSLVAGEKAELQRRFERQFGSFWQTQAFP